MLSRRRGSGLFPQPDLVLYQAVGLAAALSFLHTFGFGPERKSVLVIGAALLLASVHTAARHPHRLPLLLAAYLPFNRSFPYAYAPSLNMTNVLTVLLIVAVLGARRRRRRVRWTGFELLLLLFLGLGLASHLSAWGLHRHLSLFQFLQVYRTWSFPVVLFFLGRLALRDAGDRRDLLVVVAAVTFLITLTCWREGVDKSDESDMDDARILGVLGQPNDMGAFLVYYGTPLLSVAVTRGDRRIRVAALGCYLVVVRTLTYTYSRGAYVALLASTVAMLFLTGPHKLVLAGLGYAGVAAVVPAAIPEAALARFGHTLRSGSDDYTQFEDNLDPSVSHRLLVWQLAAEVIRDHPFLGVGPLRFRAAMLPYLWRHDEHHEVGWDAHNAYLLTAAEVGVPALVCLVLSLLYGAATGFVHYLRSRDPWDRAVALAFVSTILGVMCSSMFGSRFSDEAVSGNYWLVAAAFMTLRQEAHERRRPRSPGATGATGAYR